LNLFYLINSYTWNLDQKKKKEYHECKIGNIWEMEPVGDRKQKERVKGGGKYDRSLYATMRIE
jgi:hypothetical protein